MKILSAIALAGALPCVTPALFAGNDNLVKNGDFELYESEWVSFNDTKFWRNRGTGKEKANARRNGQGDGVLASGFQGSINDQYDERTATFGVVAHNQNTEHIIRPGESYTVDYVWKTAYQWQRERDIVRVILYATTANTPTGPVVWSAPLESGAARKENTWERISHLTEVVPPAAVGKQLFLSFYGVDLLGTSAPGYALVDNIVVQVVKPK
jgi:hypothetical protein